MLPGLELCRSIRIREVHLWRKTGLQEIFQKNLGVHGVHPNFRIFALLTLRIKCPWIRLNPCALAGSRALYGQSNPTKGDGSRSAKHGFVTRLHRLGETLAVRPGFPIAGLYWKGKLSLLESFSARQALFFPPRSTRSSAPTRCGAKTRSGTPCRSPAMSNRRCRMQGVADCPRQTKGWRGPGLHGGSMVCIQRRH